MMSERTGSPGDAAPDPGRRRAVLKERAEDFVVEEIPAYEPTGQGEHLYLLIEKRNATTSGVARALAREFDAPLRAVGYAGLKDRHAITRQWFSVHDPHRAIDESAVVRLDREWMRVLEADRHGNKLRRGHLKGNRFRITARGVGMAAAPAALAALRGMESAGVANFFGHQRFGARGSNHLIGRAIILAELQEAVDRLLGLTEPGDDARVDAPARRLYEERRYAEALVAFASSAVPERRALAALRRGGKARDALRAVGPIQRGFWLSAFQSAVFNDALRGRVRSGRLDQLEVGDIAFKHDCGAVFEVTAGDLGLALDARLSALQISPSGPLWGPAMKCASGRPGDEERAALDRSGVTMEDLARAGRVWKERGLGSRRAMRVGVVSPTVEAGADEHGEFVRCDFSLPPGAYATVVMDRVFSPADALVAGGRW